MQYLKVLWKHDDAEEPVWLFSELDDDRWEIRKVEVFADGTAGFASQDEESGGATLSTERWPSLAEIAEDPQFVPTLINEDEFEKVWQMRKDMLRT